MFVADRWKDYALLDTGGGEKLEDVGGIILRRPDPQAIWEKSKPEIWRPHAYYERSDTGGGSWRFLSRVPERWTVGYGALKFYVRPTGFKHIGLFPEQSVNWDYIAKAVAESGRKIKMLNLFAYTGGATAAAAAAGAEVVHVDAAKSMNDWAKDNLALSGVGSGARFMADDCLLFVRREQRRGNRYDAIAMDPPSYGRSGNRVWKMEDDLYGLIRECAKLLSDEPLFFIVNAYTTGLSDIVTANMLEMILRARFGGSIESGTLALPQKGSKILLPCGTTSRWRP